MRAAAAYGIPSQLRGDHGVENILVAAWMEAYSGAVQRTPYIWGRYVIQHKQLSNINGLLSEVCTTFA